MLLADPESAVKLLAVEEPDSEFAATACGVVGIGMLMAELNAFCACAVATLIGIPAASFATNTCANESLAFAASATGTPVFIAASVNEVFNVSTPLEPALVLVMLSLRDALAVATLTGGALTDTEAGIAVEELPFVAFTSEEAAVLEPLELTELSALAVFAVAEAVNFAACAVVCILFVFTAV